MLLLLSAALAASPPDCPRGVVDPASRYAQGQALIQASLVGEHHVGWDYLWGLRALREAADSGDRDAMYQWGRERFSNLYMSEAPAPDRTADRQIYVEALAAITTAARLGQAAAQGFLPPPVLSALLDTDHAVPDTLDLGQPPLVGIPVQWLEEVRQVVSHDQKCWPSAELGSSPL